MSKNVSEVMEASMAKVREMVDANTVVGQPITAGNAILIPVSKISFGLASGGADLPAKNPNPNGTFGGGAGCGVKIVPVAMIVVQDDRVRMLPVGEPASSAAERIIEQLPELVDKLTDLIRERRTDISEI